MKVHYINILLFSLPLNILEHNPWNHYMKPHTYTNRSLCECDLYMTNYDNDPELKKVKEQFNKQTQQRFHEYDDRMKTTRQKCREECDKECQKIILKDKLEKQMEQQFSTLHTDIQRDAIPTCVCEKSVADKVEKNCMKCTQNLGGIVAPSSGVLAGIAEGALIVWKPLALEAAIAAAKEAGAAKGFAEGAQAGIKAVMNGLLTDLGLSIEGVQKMGLVFNAKNYTNVSMITEALCSKFQGSCIPPVPVSGVSYVPFSVADTDLTFCNSVWPTPFPGNSGSGAVSAKDTITNIVNGIVADAKFTAGATAQTATEEATTTLTAQKTGVVQTTYMGYQTPIIASVVAIVVIVLIMVIIYLILRYRRKKKMKKKLQYIKLLKE
ncbi:hypothetical protein PFNF135_00674 [Plasmodium falciparum NF135/5.C10]|uniref:Surface antigen n=1 Tax=Plasmodium falciparum NF135/5.C10 TaxID=1036726 RepID=W4IPE9_PLAFA|nr:hypothetical protein PFNF135_00674 [Plasmodium falciparum NF135/5.C10]